jgi:predicted phage tail protein
VAPIAATVPDAPTSLSATAVNDTTIDLAWTDNSDDEDTFRVEVSDDGVSGWVTVYDDLSPDTESVSVINLDPDTEYFFRVFAVNEAGDSDPTNTDSATTEAADTGSVELLFTGDGVW